MKYVPLLLCSRTNHPVPFIGCPLPTIPETTSLPAMGDFPSAFWMISQSADLKAQDRKLQAANRKQTEKKRVTLIGTLPRVA
jgi:hypothetical protein